MSPRINSPKDLDAIRAKAQAEIDLRTGGKDVRITVHMGTCGIAAGARDVLTALMSELSGAAAANVSLQQSGCAGLCDQEPMISVTDADGATVRYGRLDKAKVGQIVRDHVLRGQVVNEFLIKV
jgi:(2Fe-2S) ferredoxin